MAQSTIIKHKETTLVIDSYGKPDSTIISIESNYTSDYNELSITLNNDDLRRIYNKIGKILGYPEMKESENV